MNPTAPGRLGGTGVQAYPSAPDSGLEADRDAAG